MVTKVIQDVQFTRITRLLRTGRGYLSRGSHYANLGWLLYGFMALALPMTSETCVARSQKFDSRYTDLDKDCRQVIKPVIEAEEEETGEDMPRICRGFGGYHVRIGYSAMATHVGIESDDGSFSLPLQAKTPCFQHHSRKIEWREVNGQTFAVIARIICYRMDTLSPEVSRNRTRIGEYLLVRGLKGHENFSQDIDVDKSPYANALARRVADGLRE